jgi:hypothetical protein
LATSNLWKATNADYEAKLIYNFTSRGGFFANQPINVSAIVIHEKPNMENVTRLLFDNSRKYPIEFREIPVDSDIFVPQGGHIDLDFWKRYNNNGTMMGIYKGTGRIIYDLEGSYSATLELANVSGIVFYNHSLHQSSEPTIQVGRQSELDQIKDNKVVLAHTWGVTGLTILTIIFAVDSVKKEITRKITG